MHKGELTETTVSKGTQTGKSLLKTVLNRATYYLWPD